MARPRMTDAEKRRKGTYQPSRSENRPVGGSESVPDGPPAGKAAPPCPEGIGDAGAALWGEIWHLASPTRAGQFQVTRALRMADDIDRARATFTATGKRLDGKAVTDAEAALSRHLMHIRKLGSAAATVDGEPSKTPKIDAFRARYKQHLRDVGAGR